MAVQTLNAVTVPLNQYYLSLLISLEDFHTPSIYFNANIWGDKFDHFPGSLFTPVNRKVQASLKLWKETSKGLFLPSQHLV